MSTAAFGWFLASFVVATVWGVVVGRGVLPVPWDAVLGIAVGVLCYWFARASLRAERRAPWPRY